MRVLSLNAWGGAVFDVFADALASYNADVLCLQEVTRTAGVGGWTRFDDVDRSLPQRANLFADVCTLLPHHHGVFVASDAGPVTDSTGTRHQQNFGLAVFVHERLSIIRQYANFVHGDFVVHEEWPIADRPRLAQAIRVHDTDTNRVVSITHLHGLRDPAGKIDTPQRRRQAERLADVVTTIRGTNDFSIVCGDMNLLPNSETFAVLASIGLTDLVGHASTRTSLYKKSVRHANYMLVSDPRSVARFTISHAPDVSDHCALILDV